MDSEKLMRETLWKVKQLKKKPVAIEAYWDGDTNGWFLVLVAILDEPSQLHSKYSEHDLLILQEGGDIRLFNNIVPPWPETEIANIIGSNLSKHLGIPFYFPAQGEPSDQLPRWWDDRED